MYSYAQGVTGPQHLPRPQGGGGRLELWGLRDLTCGACGACEAYDIIIIIIVIIETASQLRRRMKSFTNSSMFST